MYCKSVPTGIMWLFGLVLLALVLAGCEDDSPTLPSNYSWHAQSSGVTANLQAVWGSSADNLFAVGDAGLILHYTGGSWHKMTAVTSHTLAGVWGSGAGDVFAVGSAGTIFHFNGVSWEAQESGTTVGLLSVCGTSGSDVYAVGYGLVLHYNGSQWSTLGDAPNADFRDVFADLAPIHYGVETKIEDVFAVDLWGGFHHYDGHSWKENFENGGGTVHGVWADKSVSMVGVGGRGLFIVWNGSRGKGFNIGSTNTLLDVWGSSITNVFAVGTNGVIVHYDGQNCRAMSSHTSNILTGVIAFPDGHAVAVGYAGTILRYGP